MSSSALLCARVDLIRPETRPKEKEKNDINKLWSDRFLHVLTIRRRSIWQNSAAFAKGAHSWGICRLTGADNRYRRGSLFLKSTVQFRVISRPWDARYLDQLGESADIEGFERSFD